MGLDVGVLGEYVRHVRRAARVGREVPATDGSSRVDAERVRWRRLAVTHAATRLRPGRHADAAFGGLQDSAPRAALVALHARVKDIGPTDWEHPSLAQVWLRWADYVVPHNDVGVFTLGTQPRDPRYKAALERLATSSSPRRGTADGTAARLSTVDIDEARHDLARRFLHWLGPASPAHFAEWAGMTRLDAETTWESLAPEIEPVSFGGSRRWILADDVDDLIGAEPPLGVRLLPAGDPSLYMDDDQPSAAEPHQPDQARGITTRLLNSLTGRIVMDGAIVGAWGRVKTTVTIDPWPSLPKERTHDVTVEASSLSGPMGAPIKVRWLRRRHRSQATRS